jgi:hypothetical protein
MNRVREYRHLFEGHRRIIATMRVDLGRVGFDAGTANVFGCEWEGSKERQPSVALYREFKEWADYVFSDVVAQTGRSFVYFFELPGGVVEAWAYDPGEEPRMIEAPRIRGAAGCHREAAGFEGEPNI